MSHRSDVTLGEEVDANRPCTVDALVKKGDLWDLYRVTHDGRPGLLKISAKEEGDDPVVQEALSLTAVRSGVEPRFLPYFPVLLDVFDHRGRQACVTEWLDGCYTLQEVIEAYPGGVDPKDMAWMVRRLLVALGALHRANYIHGAVVPTNILLHPEMHGLILTNWSYAVQTDGIQAEELPTRDEAWDAWYPDSVKLRTFPVHNGLDTALAARSMVAVIGGEPLKLMLPDGAPPEFRAFFQACFGPRVPDAWSLKIGFDELIEDLWGPRRFRPFKMPEKP